VGEEIKREVAVRPVAPLEAIVVEVVEEAMLIAVLVSTKIQDCRAALIECVVVLALRGSSSFSDNGDLSLLIFGIRLGRVAGVCQTGVGVAVDERASDGQANGESEVDENGGEAHGDEAMDGKV